MRASVPSRAGPHATQAARGGCGADRPGCGRRGAWEFPGRPFPRRPRARVPGHAGGTGAHVEGQEQSAAGGHVQEDSGARGSPSLATGRAECQRPQSQGRPCSPRPGPRCRGARAGLSRQVSTTGTLAWNRGSAGCCSRTRTRGDWARAGRPAGPRAPAALGTPSSPGPRRSPSITPTAQPSTRPSVADLRGVQALRPLGVPRPTGRPHLGASPLPRPWG